MREIPDLMKRLFLSFVLIIGVVVNSAAQVTYDEIYHEDIPKYFIEGAFIYPIIFEPMLDDMPSMYDTPVQKVILDTATMVVAKL